MTAEAEAYDVVGAIMEFEDGSLDTQGTLELFSHLVKTGQAWSLQGSYGRFASSLIEGGYLTPEGDLTELAEALL